VNERWRGEANDKREREGEERQMTPLREGEERQTMQVRDGEERQTMRVRGDTGGGNFLKLPPHTWY